MTGHSHWDHSFDTATWSKLTGAPVVGSRTTCLEAAAQNLPEGRCQPVYGGERIDPAEGISLRVVRWRRPYSDPELEAFLATSHIQLVKPGQYMDKWRLDVDGIAPEANEAIKRALRLPEGAAATQDQRLRD